MIKPKVRRIHDEDYEQLWMLFRACPDWEYMSGWKFDSETTLVALHGGQVVGFLTAWHGNQPYAWVDCLVVRPDLRKHGIGAWLCFYMEKLLRTRGVKAIRAAVQTPHVVLGMWKYGFRGKRQFVLEKAYK